MNLFFYVDANMERDVACIFYKVFSTFQSWPHDSPSSSSSGSVFSGQTLIADGIRRASPFAVGLSFTVVHRLFFF
jgi:hypothetical protein